MFKFRRYRMGPDAVIRMVADAAMVNLSLLAALVAQFIWMVVRSTEPISVRDKFQEFLASYFQTFLIVTVLILAVSYGAGVYARSRSFRLRYKLLVILRSVTLAYLLLGFLSFALPNASGLSIETLALAFVVTAVVMTTSRLWSVFWARMQGMPTPRYEPEPTVSGTPTVLLIGGAGYIGSALIPKLLDKGYRVRLLDMFLYGREPVQAVLDHPRLEVVQADFRQIDAVVSAMHEADAVVHLGAIVGDPACALDEDLTIEVNLIATKMIAEVAKGRGLRRFVFASTCSVYGASDEVLDELSALNPVSLYARSKIACERVLFKMADDQFRPTMLRFGTIYGLSGRTRFDLVANLLTAKALIEGKITVFGPDQWRPFVHVDDAALAILKVLEAPLSVVGEETFNVGSNDQNYTLGQLGELINRKVPTAEMIITGGDADRRNYRVDFTKIHSEVGFRARWTLEAGVDQVMQAILDGEVKDYQDAKYSNVKFLKEEASEALTHHIGWAHELIATSNAEPVISKN